MSVFLKNAYFVDCINCGKQVLSDWSSEELCYWCNNPVRKKLQERIMVTIAGNDGESGNINQSDLQHELLPLSKFTKQQKISIAVDASKRGFKAVAAEHGLPWETVRGWVLTYCKKSKSAEEVSSNTSSCVQPKGLPLYPCFDSSWSEVVQVEWLKGYLILSNLFNHEQ